MNVIKKISFFVCVWLLLLSSKCARTDVIFQDSPPFKIFNAYTQKQVPGEQGKKPYVELGFEVKGLADGTVLDSIFCEVGKSIEIKADGINRIKFLGKESLINVSKDITAIIYYSQKGSKFYYVLHHIEKKETMYLP